MSDAARADVANELLSALKAKVNLAGREIDKLAKDLHHPYTDSKVRELKTHVDAVLDRTLRATGVPLMYGAAIKRSHHIALEVQLGLRKTVKNVGNVQEKVKPAAKK